MRKLLATAVASSAMALILTVTSSTAAAAVQPAADPHVVASVEEPIDDSIVAPPEDGAAGDDGADIPQENVVDVPDGGGRDGNGIIRPGLFRTMGDHVHISSSPPRTASAHGWWVKIGGSGSRAKVTIWLQAKDWRDGKWKTVAKDVETVRQGGGSVARANARFTCRGIVARVEWRSVVDVDLIGVLDDDRRLTTPTKTLYCGAF